MSSASALVEHIENVPLIDHHVHGCWLQAPDRRRFENGLNEANIEPLADFDSAFDSQLGSRCARIARRCWATRPRRPGAVPASAL